MPWRRQYTSKLNVKPPPQESFDRSWLCVYTPIKFPMQMQSPTCHAPRSGRSRGRCPRRPRPCPRARQSCSRPRCRSCRRLARRCRAAGRARRPARSRPQSPAQRRRYWRPPAAPARPGRRSRQPPRPLPAAGSAALSGLLWQQRCPAKEAVHINASAHFRMPQCRVADTSAAVSSLAKCGSPEAVKTSAPSRPISGTPKVPKQVKDRQSLGDKERE